MVTLSQLADSLLRGVDSSIRLRECSKERTRDHLAFRIAAR